MSATPSYPPARNMARTFAILGFISAVLSLLIVPEIFGSVAIVLGAYTWRRERDDSRNLGLIVLIFGIICMLVGLYFTSFFELGDLLPS
jgi:membrane-bound ClpP family serine protease